MPQKKQAPSWRPPSKRTSFQDSKKRHGSKPPARHGGRTEDDARGERADRPERPYASGKKKYTPRSDRPAGDSRPSRAPRGDRFDKNNRPDRSQRPERFERSERPAGERRSERFEKSERPARHKKSDHAPSGNRGHRRDVDERPARAPRRDYDGSNRSQGRPRYDKPQARTPQRPQVVHDALEAIAVTADSAEGLEFGDLGLGQRIVETIADLGASTPFALQAATIPVALEGRHVLGRGRTGSGKTIAFAAPTVERLLRLSNKGVKRAVGRAPRALILAPTRELALQIDRTVQPIARSVGLFTTQIYGGVPLGRQIGALERGVDIVIGTPGRIEDLMARGKLDVSQVVISVVDEADHMSELGFIEPLQRILSSTDPAGQRLLFSATLDRGVSSIVAEFLPNPAVFEVAGENQESSTIDHRVYVVDQREKRNIVVALAQMSGKTLMFTRTRAFAEELADHLEDHDIPAVSLHGDLNQARRQRNLDKLTSGRVNVLVATDVAARGIHVDDIETVIQVDPPDDFKSYVHRSGRTGRAGKEGVVITLTTKPRTRRVVDLLKQAGISVTPQDMKASQLQDLALV